MSEPVNPVSSSPKSWPLGRLKSAPKFAARHQAEPARRRAGTPAKTPRTPARAVRVRLLATAIA
jgi:hypothetical protein